MDKCSYQEISVNCSKGSKLRNGIFLWKPFLRQLLICTGVWTSYFMYGLCVGSPTVLIPQIRREANTTVVISDEMASWLTSVFSISGFPWVLILTIFTKFMGRKLTFMIACIDTFAAFVVLYCSTNVTQILISEVMQGLLSATHIIISIMIITEYTSPRYRGLFLTIKSATFYWGVWASNAIGTFFHWKKIALFGILCAIYTLVTIILWPESPYWLASRGRYEECAVSHRWLKGCDKESEKELDSLLNSQKEYLKTCQKMSMKEHVKNFFVTIKSKEFYKPTLISILSGSLGVVTGKLVCTVYAIDVIKKITESESTAYTGMLLLDGITITSMYVGCALARFLNRRTLLLVTSTIGVVIILTMSLYLYLISLSVISENKYVSISLLTAFSVAVSCGPLILSSSIYGELIPLRSRNLSGCMSAVVGMVEIGALLKVAPYLFKSFGLHGSFLCFGILSSICILLICKYLPETKDKTLQEIADIIKGVQPKLLEEVPLKNRIVRKDF